MASWRDTASTEAEIDLEMLMGLSLSTAQHTLDDLGELFPFSIAIDKYGEVRRIRRRGPPRNEVELHKILQSSIKHELEAIRAVALVFDYQSKSTIVANLEHRDGTALVAELSYRRVRVRIRRFRRVTQYEYAASAAVYSGERMFW